MRCVLLECVEHRTVEHVLCVPLAVQLSSNAFTGMLPVEWADSSVRFPDWLGSMFINEQFAHLGGHCAWPLCRCCLIGT